MTDGVFHWTNDAGADPEPPAADDDTRRRRSFLARCLLFLIPLAGATYGLPR